MPISAADRIAIHELVSLHGHLTDDRKLADLDQLLTPDAAYDVSAYGLGVVEGLDALTELFTAAPGDQPRGHLVTNVLVTDTDESDDLAWVRSKGLAVKSDGTADTVVYEDTVVRTPAGWRISRRRVVPRS